MRARGDFAGPTVNKKRMAGWELVDEYWQAVRKELEVFTDRATMTPGQKTGPLVYDLRVPSGRTALPQTGPVYLVANSLSSRTSH